MNPEEQKRARKKAMCLLEHMDRTKKGLSDKLRQAGFSKESIEDALEYVESFGYLDDARYARTYIAGRINQKSKMKILMELGQKGIDPSVASEAWEEVQTLWEPDERAVLRANILKKYPENSRLDEKQMRRLYGFLARRGFAWNDISSVLEELDIVQVSGNRDAFF